jgi:hypothetical protein
MNRAMKVAALGAGIGFFVMIWILLFRVRSPFVVNFFWPTHFLANPARGLFWMLTVGTFAFFANAFLYGLVGYGIGRLMYGTQQPDKPSS